MMASYLYVGEDRRDFPGDGVRPSMTVSPGDVIEVDGWTPDDRYFDPVNGHEAGIHGSDASTAATATDTEPQE
jgi:hypothetical protein